MAWPVAAERQRCPGEQPCWGTQHKSPGGGSSKPTQHPRPPSPLLFTPSSIRGTTFVSPRCVDFVRLGSVPADYLPRCMRRCRQLRDRRAGAAVCAERSALCTGRSDTSGVGVPLPCAGCLYISKEGSLTKMGLVWAGL